MGCCWRGVAVAGCECWLGLAPFEFAVQDLEVGFFLGLDQLQAFGGAGHAHSVGWLHGYTGLPVQS